MFHSINMMIVSIICSFLMIVVSGYVSKCVQPGMKCADCQTLIHCVGYPNNDLISNQITFCNNSENLFCSVEAGGCVGDITACNKFGLKKIDCQAPGSFPDPYDCNTYHVCSENGGTLSSTSYKCPDDRAFDPLTSTCRFKSNHEVCTKSPVPKCTRLLQTESIKQNPNIYFVCVSEGDELKHLFYRCQPGQIFSRNNCIETNFKCQAKGKYKDNANCRKYYHCREDLTHVHHTCHLGSYFSAEHGTCVKGSCPKDE